MTHFGPTLRILGLLLMLFSLTMLPPIGISVIFDDGQIPLFGAAAGLIFGAGFISWLPARRQKRDLRIRDGFVITVLFWLVLGSAGSVPLALSEQLNLSMTDALFESISGLTTTGATVIVGLDHLPKSVLFYRQQLQWLGGMGIVVLAVAILPMLGIGGMQLYRAETPGPVKDAKLSPRIAETAKALWLIYLSLTAACALAYWISGMAIFDAICHAFSTIAIGGFSPYDASIGHFNSVSIETVAIVFMVISGMNFSLHFIAWHNNSLKHYLHDPEWKTYLLFLFGLSLLISLALVENGTYPVNEAFRKGIFEVVSIATTTGFTTADYASWPTFIPFLLLMSAFIGACAGSTGGGIKIIRMLLLYKQGSREIKRLIHPNAVIPIKLGRKPVGSRVIDAVWGFLAAYVLIFAVLMLVCMALGEDPITAYSAVGACLNNLGPGLGDATLNYSTLSDGTKYVLSFAMLLGRLELFTLLVVLSPSFWEN
ncbi:MAG TPA: potassium transporter [Gammaproteobacteria bacterium]|jgi:trk system potassium uptake protein TrkH|nr:TrkH family potassium uptake protein [Litorivicinus sp.]MDA8548830.1 TrkH family potassium uptake protein [Litorivicinaceae bacterium]MDF1783160.1 TrkH family potassium uptake protein [Litorivicinaceae bacterium]NBR74928.1 potassium transporter [Gammaproteobacteria bacterium]HAY55643.1 potassium transporter [Gammaproteobacteria bacterium]